MLEEVLQGRPSTPCTSLERKDHTEGKAKELLDEGMRLLGLSTDNLQNTPKGLKEKRVLAWYIKKNTTASLRWLSEALNMGHISNETKKLRLTPFQKPEPLTMRATGATAVTHGRPSSSTRAKSRRHVQNYRRARFFIFPEACPPKPRRRREANYPSHFEKETHKNFAGVTYGY